MRILRILRILTFLTILSANFLCLFQGDVIAHPLSFPHTAATFESLARRAIREKIELR